MSGSRRQSKIFARVCAETFLLISLMTRVMPPSVNPRRSSGRLPLSSYATGLAGISIWLFRGLGAHLLLIGFLSVAASALFVSSSDPADPGSEVDVLIAGL
jgi:hypothetical protein